MNPTLQALAKRYTEPAPPNYAEPRLAEVQCRYEQMIQFELDFAHSPQRASDYMKGRRHDSCGTLLVTHS